MVDVKVAGEDGAYVGWRVLVKFFVKGVEGVVRVVRWAVPESE